MAEEMSVEELVDEFVDKFDTEINVQIIASRSSLKEEADRYKHTFNQCNDKKLPIYESLTLGFSRKVELELVNFNEAARGLLKCMREQLIHKLDEYDEDSVENFTERATKIIHDESEALRNSLRSSYLEVMGEMGYHITKEVRDFAEIVAENDFKRRHRRTEMNMPLEPTISTEKVDIEKEIVRRTEQFDGLLKTISDNFTNLLANKKSYSKTLIDANINADLPVFGMIVMHFNVESWDHFKNQKRLINSTIEETLSQLSRLTDQPDSFSVTGIALQQKAKGLFESIERQLNASTTELDKYRDEERRDIFRRDAATRPNEESITVPTIDDEGAILFDGRIRRDNQPLEIDLDGVELEEDDKGRKSCQLKRTVLLELIRNDKDDIDTFAVQKYAHTNLLKCLGTATYNRDVRYLVFDFFLDTLATTLQEKPQGLGQDDFIQYLNGLRQAIEYLHENNLFHGDLRPENVYFEWMDDEDYSKVKLAHFSTIGAREIVERACAEQNSFSSPEAGPETTLLLLQKSDIWSFGTLIWHALTAVTPCEQKIAELPSTIIGDSSASTIGVLLKKCWSKLPEDRPSIYEIGEIITAIVEEIAFTFEEDKQWTDECAKWKAAASQIQLSE